MIKKLKNIKADIGAFIEKNRTEVIVLVIILILGALFRLYRIDAYLTFLGDEGRDVLVVRRFLTEGKVFLIGPGTSIGNMYLGPLYYYMIALPLLLANFSPVGPAVMVALLGVITIFLVWFVTREWFPVEPKRIHWGALMASLLYAATPVVIVYSRSSWNPNIMPFFAIVCVFAIWRILSRRQLYWLTVLGVSYAFVLQSHYLGLLLAPTLAILWLYGLYVFIKDKKTSLYIRHSIFGMLLFVFLMSPLVIFDIRHGGQNFESMRLFFTERQTTVSARPWTALPEIWPLSQKIITDLVAGGSAQFGPWIALALFGGFAYVVSKAKKLTSQQLLAFSIIAIWLGFSFLGLALYKQEIYSHYYGFFFVTPFIAFGGMASTLIANARFRGWWIVGTIFSILLYVNIANSPLLSPPNGQLARTREVAQKIQQESAGSVFNLAVIAERNYEAAYEYFLVTNGANLLKIDPQNTKNTITKQLFVVCEKPRQECNPTHDPKAEIANFGWSAIESEWDVAGVTLFKLIHTR